MLIAKGKGLVVIPNDKVEEYKSLLIAYYEGKDDVSIKEFLRKFAFVEIWFAIKFNGKWSKVVLERLTKTMENEELR